jgi:hypothetical protein
MPHSGAADRLPHGLDQAADETRPGHTPANGPATAQTEPTQPDPAQPDPAQPDPAQPDPAQPDPARPDPDPGLAGPHPVDPGPPADAGGSAVVETWPATSRTRLPVCVSYIDVRPGTPGRPVIS